MSVITPIPNLFADYVNGAAGNSGLGYYKFSYTGGGTAQPQIGDVLTGDTSGATCYILNYTTTSGSWAAGSAAGTMYISAPAVAAIQNGENMSLSGSATQSNVLTTSSTASIDSLQKIDDITAAKGLGVSKTITNATNANPIVITSTAHGYISGQYLCIAEVRGNTAANGIHKITVIDANSYSIPVAGNGAYIAGGKSYLAIAGLAESGSVIDAGVLATFTANSRTVTTGATAGTLAQTYDFQPFHFKAITGATNASPIVITSTAHGFVDGQRITILNVGGNTAANGAWVVANKTDNTYELTGSTGNGTYTSGGYATNWTAYNSGGVNRGTTDNKSFADKVGLYTPTTPTTATKYFVLDLGAAVDLTAFQIICHWIKGSATTGNWVFKLCSDDVGDTAVVTMTEITGNTVYNTFRQIKFDNGSALSNTIRSIAIYTGTVATNTTSLVVDNLIACKSGGLTLDSLISYSNANKIDGNLWFPIKTIHGTTITIDNDVSAVYSSGRGFSSVWTFLEATNANPIVYKTDQPHGLPSGAVATIIGFTGNTNANVTAEAITVVDSDHFSCAVAGNGVAAAFQSAKISVLTTELYIRNSIKTTPATTSSANVQACQVSGVPGAYITYEGGINPTTMEQVGETLFDGQNGYGYCIQYNSKSYLKFKRLGFIRYNSIDLENVVFELGNFNLIALTSQAFSGSLLILNGYQNFINYLTTAYLYNSGVKFIQESGFLNCCGFQTFGIGGDSNFKTGVKAKNCGVGFYFRDVPKINNLVTQDCTTASFYIDGIANQIFLKNSLISEATLISYMNGYSSQSQRSVVYSQNHNRITDNNIQTYLYSTVTRQTAEKPADASFAFKMTATNTIRRSDFPTEMKIGSFRVASSGEVTIKVRIFKDNEGIAGGVLVKGRQLAGVDDDVIVLSTNVTDWTDGNALTTLTFTPTEAGWFDLYGICYNYDGITTYTYNVYLTVAATDVNGNIPLVTQA